MDTLLLSTILSLSILQSTPILGGPAILAEQQMSLDTRYQDNFVNEVFKDNILLNLAYLKGDVKKASDISWDEVKKPFTYQFKLNPKEVFAYHDSVLPEFEGRVVLTTKAHFNALEGFKSDGYLFGDGVCHLASLINWAAREARLEVKSPTNHDFANIPEIDKKFGVSIYSQAGKDIGSAYQNLYITNNQDKPIIFKFIYQDNNLKVSVLKDT